ncbi:BTAD domain-containing putative transcriptional regulator [Cellulomonas cellasea]|uniref:Putative ATPase n=1 Tax=Cellulomonas cellasea TaxID=43670 RepID=A0A7W4YAV0_9CELL|nr:BTAD domain-containing putative transcriptional regulator [Cellulomonas cellasea]MBB2922132.1 putative ATPase [Cellulomonas cellasea]
MQAVDAVPDVRVDVLGPLRLTVGDAAVDVVGTRRRAVLALLALAPGRTVTVATLVDALWPGGAPASGRQPLQSHVSRLRAQLGPAGARLVTVPDGYRLDLPPGAVDLGRARTLVREARTTADAAHALALLREAAALWRGPVLADLTDVPPVRDAVVACERLRRETTEALVAAGLAAGRAPEVLELAAAAAAQDPLAEPSTVLHVRALAATGRAPDALRVARAFRRRLAEETGLDPTPALAAAEREVAAGVAGPGTTDGAEGGVPHRVSALVGRAEQVAALRGLLAHERLVTLAGTGGVGKTSVALEVARSADDAVVLTLAPVDDPGAVPHALAAALGLAAVRGDVLTACAALLADRPALLLVDNAEHLLAAVRDAVATLLAACPRLRVLVTSREPLGLAAERTVRLSPLPVPEPGADAAHVRDSPAVALFLARADRVRPGVVATADDLTVVAEVVRRLDGIPLAIELAAGRLSTLGLRDLRDRLDRALDLLGDGRPTADARHRTLRATIAWSDALLAADERLLLQHLAAFPDGLDLAAAEGLARAVGTHGDPATLLARLVDASVLHVDFDGGTRFRMLETVRAYAAGTADGRVGPEHLLRWARDLAADVAAGMETEREPEADATLRRELANLRAAWHAARTRGTVDDAAALVVGLFEAVAYRDLLEIRAWSLALAEDPALEGHPRAAAVLGVAAEAAYQGGDPARAESLARAGLACAHDDEGRWFCLLPLAVVALARGAHADAVGHAVAAATLRAAPRETFGIAALATAYGGALDAARSLADRGRSAATSPTLRAWAAYVDGEIAQLAGDLDDAEAGYVDAVAAARASGAGFLLGVAHVGLVSVQAARGRVREALTGYREVVDRFAATGNWTHLWAALRDLADLLWRLGDGETAALLHSGADAAPDAPADPRRPRRSTPLPGPPRAAVLTAAREAVERALVGLGDGATDPTSVAADAGERAGPPPPAGRV